MPGAPSVPDQSKTEASIDQLSINTVRTLAVDAVQAAHREPPAFRAGHPQHLIPAGARFDQEQFFLYTHSSCRHCRHVPPDRHVIPVEWRFPARQMALSRRIHWPGERRG